MATDFDTECFFIAPIGPDDSDIRKRSDDVRDWVVKPAAEAAAGLKTVRADDVGEPGQITAQAVQHCLKAKASVADLTEGNPNVYYELSVRHGAQLPVVLIAEVETELPFDISQSRVIFFDHQNLSSAGKAKQELQAQIEASLTGTPDNPIYDGMRLAQLQAGNAEEQTLALVMARLERLSQVTEQIDGRLRRTERNGRLGGLAYIDTLGGRGVIPKGSVESPRIRRVHMADGSTRSEYVPPLDDAGDDLSLEERAEQEVDRSLFDPGDDPLAG